MLINARGLGEEIHVVEARGTAANHFSGRESCAVLGELRCNPLLLSRHNLIIEPVHQLHIIGKSTE